MASLLTFRNVFLALAALVLSFLAFSQNTAVEAAGKGPKITHKVSPPTQPSRLSCHPIKRSRPALMTESDG